MIEKKKGRAWAWVTWAALTVCISGYLGVGLFTTNAGKSPWLAHARSMFLPGKTTHGHYQIELACEGCHTSPFGGKDALQDACVKCHGAELKAANDTHPQSKFTDPRNADRLEKLEATLCVTCHTEHRPQITHAMGLTLPQNVCFHCHAEIGKDRPSHKDLGFETCGSAGCHKYHDNRALYGDFLVKHAREPIVREKPVVLARDFAKVVGELDSYPVERFPRRALAASDADAPAALERTPEVMNEWLASTHAKSGVNCSGCHVVKQKAPSSAREDAGDGARQNEADRAARPDASIWVKKPDHSVCAECHQNEVKGFLASRHGMRLERGLTPLSPAMARQPMKADAHSKSLGCATCHGAHTFDTRKAQVEACTGCHDDRHSRAYLGSPHHELWKKELAGKAPAGSGVTCATCHLPRVEHRQDDVKRTLVQHNQNDTLRPAEKMIRPVCMSCHGLGFSIDAVADAALALNNYRGRPKTHIRSIEMALETESRAEESRQREKSQQ
jgi:formate-dependent nitrite reductase cytochrome c552 subunit